MNSSRRTFLANAAAGAMVAALVRPAHAEPSGTVFTPEMFGAKGDGVTNDSAAFAAVSEHVNEAGGGTIRFRRRTYVVGVQSQAGDSDRDYAFAPSPLLALRGCTKPLVIEGNGARLKCAPGLRFGTFDPVSGEPTEHDMPYFNRAELSSPYHYMIHVADCSGPVLIENIELDGSLPDLLIGGQYGDTGWQIAATGIYLENNRGDEIVHEVHSHHHPQDGLMINGDDDAALARRVTRRIDNLRSEDNGRQGCSIVGGRGYRFSRCRFNRSGRGPVSSNPGAGVDIEAEGGKINRDFAFADCEFADNVGCGMVADSGDSEDATFTRCTFIGTTNWSVWPFKPRFRFDRCTIVGTAVKCFGDEDPARAAQFRNCTFSDDPALSPTGEVYREGREDGPLADLSDSRNMLFHACDFRADGGAVLPWSVHAIYSACTMRQRSQSIAYPRGTYIGQSRIDGRVDLYGSRIAGRLRLNGSLLSGVQL